MAGRVDGDLSEVGRAAAASISPTDDVHASAGYRTHVAPVVVRRALERALEEARR